MAPKWRVYGAPEWPQREKKNISGPRFITLNAIACTGDTICSHVLTNSLPHFD